MKRHIPNLLTLGRIGLTLVSFGALIRLGDMMRDGAWSPLLAQLALWCFVVAAVTDFLDGYLARLWEVESQFGAILDPIGDKLLVCGAIVGLLAVSVPYLALPAGLILFREFGVSAMREVLAPKGLKLPVTELAKWKTTVQLVALTIPLVGLTMGGPTPLGGFAYEALQPKLLIAQIIALWAAAGITLITGLQYALSAAKALKR